MKKETAKQKIQQHLWNWKYRVSDISRLVPGDVQFDLLIQAAKDGKTFRLKVLEKEDEMKKELTILTDRIAEGLTGNYDAVAIISGGKKKFAGGSQKVPIFTDKHKEVFN